MQILLDFLRRYNYLFLFAFLEVTSIVLLLKFNNYQGSAWMTAANNTAARVNAVYADADAFVQLGDVNSQLNAENVRLQQENEQLRQALADARQDTTLTYKRILENLGKYKLIPARVNSNTIRAGVNGYLVIDRGSDDGVRPEMGVISSGGVVGIVYITGRNNSVVIPVTHSKSNISCRVRGQNYFGTLQWDGSNTRTSFVNDIPRYAQVQKGRIIETSGYSSIFPPGIFIGRVKDVANSSDGQSYRLNVVMGNDFASLRDVNVIATPYKAEIDSITRKARELDDKP